MVFSCLLWFDTTKIWQTNTLVTTQLTFICSKSTTETIEKGKKYAQSQQYKHQNDVLYSGSYVHLYYFRLCNRKYRGVFNIAELKQIFKFQAWDYSLAWCVIVCDSMSGFIYFGFFTLNLTYIQLFCIILT